MLTQLHDAILKVCPIVGVSELGDGQYRIDFAETATLEQQLAAYSVIANFQPVEPPNWEQFRAQMLMNGGYLRIVASNPLNQVFNAALVWKLGQLGSHPEMLGELANLWNAMAMNVVPTEQEATVFRTIAQSCNMPFLLNEQGLISLP